MIKLIHILGNKFWNSSDWSKITGNAEIITINVNNSCIIIHVKGLLDCFVSLTNIHVDQRSFSNGWQKQRQESGLWRNSQIIETAKRRHGQKICFGTLQCKD